MSNWWSKNGKSSRVNKAVRLTPLTKKAATKQTALKKNTKAVAVAKQVEVDKRLPWDKRSGPIPELHIDNNIFAYLVSWGWFYSPKEIAGFGSVEVTEDGKDKMTWAWVDVKADKNHGGVESSTHELMQYCLEKSIDIADVNMQWHTHPGMPVFWSPTDTNDHAELMEHITKGVIGKARTVFWIVVHNMRDFLVRKVILDNGKLVSYQDGSLWVNGTKIGKETAVATTTTWYGNYGKGGTAYNDNHYGTGGGTTYDSSQYGLYGHLQSHRTYRPIGRSEGYYARTRDGFTIPHNDVRYAVNHFLGPFTYSVYINSKTWTPTEELIPFLGVWSERLADYAALFAGMGVQQWDFKTLALEIDLEARRPFYYVLIDRPAMWPVFFKTVVQNPNLTARQKICDRILKQPSEKIVVEYHQKQLRANKALNETDEEHSKRLAKEIVERNKHKGGL